MPSARKSAAARGRRRSTWAPEWISALALPLPQPKTEHGITYLSGGIGHEEALAIKAEARHYPLSLVFAAGRHNEYLADVKVTIKDRNNKAVVDTVSTGPIMLLKVPAGRYAIAAESNGKTLHRTVQVKAKGERQVVLHWPSAT
jgi:hypothetical protein